LVAIRGNQVLKVCAWVHYRTGKRRYILKYIRKLVV